VAILHWALKDITYEVTATGVQIKVFTFQPCHLWLRWTLTYPQEHSIPVIRRGLPIHSDKRFCFVSYHDNEQAEGDDTYIHTFLKEPWAHCETRFFYFHGRMGGERSKSTSCIFSYHRVQPEVATLIIEHDPAYSGAARLYTDAFYGNTFQPPYDFKLTKIEVRHNYYVYPQCVTGILELRDTPTECHPLPTLIATSSITLPTLPSHRNSIFVSYPFTQQLLLQDHLYLFLGVGCIAYPGSQGHQTAHASIGGYCPDCHLWVYHGYLPAPCMEETPPMSQQHKVWGIPV